MDCHIPCSLISNVQEKEKKRIFLFFLFLFLYFFLPPFFSSLSLSIWCLLNIKEKLSTFHFLSVSMAAHNQEQLCANLLANEDIRIRREVQDDVTRATPHFDMDNIAEDTRGNAIFDALSRRG